MSDNRTTLEDVERLAKMVGLMIDPAYLPTVASNFRILLDQAALFVDQPIDPMVEPAPVFHP